MPFEWSAALLILQLIYLEGILSIDNAAVLGAMVVHLPEDETIPWPGGLRFLRQPVHRLLGGQRLAALKVGLFGAYVGRGSMLFAAAWVIRNKWLLLLGGFYLIYLATTHFAAEAEVAEEEAHGIRAAHAERTFWSVVVNVELADLAFSLDNVVAAVALSREMWVVLTGVFLGIVTMRFAAGIFARLIEREPLLEAAAYLLVLAIGIELLAEELLHYDISRAGKFFISVAILGGTLLYAHWVPLRIMGRRMVWIRHVLAYLNVAVRTVLWPVSVAIRGVGRLAAAAMGTAGGRGEPVATDPAADPPPPGGNGGR